MLRSLFLILLYPFIFLTGFFPRKLLPVRPTYSFIYAQSTFISVIALNWITTGKLSPHGMLILMLQFILPARWAIGWLLAWVALDVLILIFGPIADLRIFNVSWCWYLFIIFLLRADAQRSNRHER